MTNQSNLPPPQPPPQPPAVSGPRINSLLLIPALVGAAIALALGVYGSLHTPAGVAVNIGNFSGPQVAKSWLATGSVAAAVAQVISALVMYGKLPVKQPSWIGKFHRWSGRTAFILAVPVAIHCLYALGFQALDLRVLVHSLAGCVFFGAFTVKMLALAGPGKRNQQKLPRWALPYLGGLAFATLVILWWTSAWWFFTTFGVSL